MNIKDLATRNTFTAKERTFIKFEADRLGINTNLRKGCNNCYQDLAVQIYSKEKTDLSDKKFVLKRGVDIFFPKKNLRVNAATLTDEIATQMIDAGLTDLFEKYES